VPDPAGDPLAPDVRLVAVAPPLRILVVADVFPWPARDGYRLRLASVLNALSGVGTVDLFVGAFEGEGDPPGPPPSFVRRHRIVVAPSARPSLGLAVRTTYSRLPRRILWRDWSAARAVIRRFAEEPYDLVWYSHADSYAALGGESLGPAVVDLDNLEHMVLRRSLRPFSLSGSLRGLRHAAVRQSARALAKSALDRRDTLLWARLQRRIATSARSTVVCSDIDRRRLGARRVGVVPNGYEDPGPPDAAVPDAPLLVMVARFTYLPNLIGAQWLAQHVVPHIRRSVPDARVRLVGRHDERLREMATVPGIEIVGEVPEIGPELRSARGAVVPLLTGSGTRIKVIEALAYGLPVVTTGVGSEGIDVEPGRHALIHDDPESFAEACAEVLMDDGLCRHLRDEGRGLFLSRYDNEIVMTTIRGLAATVTARAS
jgi:glycosyltransferase involved in cell wall biosynthesis